MSNPQGSDVAGTLFTSTYRATKLAGKAPPPADLSGTGSEHSRCGRNGHGRHAPSLASISKRRGDGARETATIAGCFCFEGRDGGAGKRCRGARRLAHVWVVRRALAQLRVGTGG
eukprot:355827-Chlamydomonas_euryale.AAC.5